ncbi:MAG TPA: hypothetical protein VG963_02415 [Polyangiaceae bacterium]|nr:hypothetical protein [Polyangiaceae bacterium]
MPASDWSCRALIALARSGERVRFRALGRSMGRAIPSRSLVEISPCTGSELAVGQIAAFERGGRVVVHRVAALKPGAVQFASDAQGLGDGWVAFENVLGRAHVVERPRRGLRAASLALLRRLLPRVRKYMASRGESSHG